VDFSQTWRAARDAKAHFYQVVDLTDDGHQAEAEAYLGRLRESAPEVHDEVRALMAQHYGTPEA